jgi:hypothetical protein
MFEATEDKEESLEGILIIYRSFTGIYNHYRCERTVKSFHFEHLSCKTLNSLAYSNTYSNIRIQFELHSKSVFVGITGVCLVFQVSPLSSVEKVRPAVRRRCRRAPCTGHTRESSPRHAPKRDAPGSTLPTY